jgi:ribonucleoside-triphosphate reductase
MIIEYSYTPEFEEVFNELKKLDKYNELADLDGIGKQVDIGNFSRKFFSKNQNPTADVSVDSNANVEDSSVIAYEVEAAKPIQRLNAYFLLYKYGKQLFDKETAIEMVKGQFLKDYYINDFHKFYGISYCFNFSCVDVMFSGLPFIHKIKSLPPKHLSSFMGQIVQFITYASNSVAGAVGLADLLICASYYVDKDKVEDQQIKQELQSFVYSVNQPFRSGVQSPFSNLSVYDDVFLTKLCSEYHMPDGSMPNKETVKCLQRIYLDLMNETLKVTPVTFPVTTACFSINDDKDILDKDFLHEIMVKNLEFGFINIYSGKTGTLSSCCRLRNDAETDKEYFNSFGSGGTKIGSISVVTLNLPRIAYEAKGSVEKFIAELRHKVELISKINHVKRHIVKKRVLNGNLPLYTHGFMEMTKQYSTCGVNGINETVSILGYDILTEEGQNLTKIILQTVNEINSKMQVRFKAPHNCEQTPSENSAIKLAQTDKLLGYQHEYNLYSNQFIPLTVKADLLDRIKLQGMFDGLMTGGAILHVNVDMVITDPMLLEKLVVHSVKQGVIYQAINYNIQQCEDEHMCVGKGINCSVCGKPVINNFTRVVGFLTSVKNWAKVRREQDYPNRQWYQV